MRLRDSLTRLGACVLLGLAGLGGTAHAAGTAAGTPINNSATLTYKVGGVDQGSICSSPGGNSTSTCVQTTFQVDNKINLGITTSDTTPVKTTPGSSGTMTFRITNHGNATQDFALTTTINRTGSVQYMFGGNSASTVQDTFNPNSCTILNGATPTTLLDNIAADGWVIVKVVCEVPTGTTNNDIAAVTLVATALSETGATLTQSATNDANSIDIVFADGTGTEEESARDAKYSARSAVEVETAMLRVTKSFVTLCDPAGGALTSGPNYEPKSIPGAYIRYTVTITNDAAAPVSAYLTQLVDTLNTARVTFDQYFITGANVSAGPPVTPGCAASGAGGTETSAGNSFRVNWAGVQTRASFGGVSGTKYLTSAAYTAPTITINWDSVLPVEGGYAQAELKAGDTISLTFNVIIN
jgi:hypothetical protein